MFAVVTVGSVTTTFHAMFNSRADAETFLNADDTKKRFWSAEIRLFTLGDIMEHEL